jgi:eukaryotic-like serine/threonine-protein kinase
MAQKKGHSPDIIKKKSGNAVEKLLALLVKHAFLAFLAFLLAAVTFAVTMNWIVMPYYQKTGVEIRTPLVTGKTIEDAKNIARKSHLSVVLDTLSYDNTIPENYIVFQYPQENTLVKPNRVIHVTVSKGAKPIKMPSVMGLSQQDAEYRIRSAGLDMETPHWIRSNKYIRGIVAGQEPQGGEDVFENTKVVLYISNGLPETNITMPNLIELSLSAAKDTLRTYNFNINHLDIHYENAPELLPETVIDQNPDPGTLTNTNSIITLDVSKSE